MGILDSCKKDECENNIGQRCSKCNFPRYSKKILSYFEAQKIEYEKEKIKFPHLHDKYYRPKIHRKISEVIK